MKQLPLPVQLRASSVFASFYGGRNTSVVDRLRYLQRGHSPKSIWIFGPAGVGKTHLLQAVCAQAGAEGGNATYLPLASPGITPDMLTGCEDLAFICLDDIEAIAGERQWEHALFRLYTELESGRMLIAAKSPPSALRWILPDLASRLAVSDILRIESLNDEELCAALLQRAEQLGLELPLDVAQFLLRRLPRDMSTLCAAIDALDRASLATQRRLTLPFVRGLLDSTEQTPP